MAAATKQAVVREIRELMLNRGLRFPNHSGTLDAISGQKLNDGLKVYAQANGDASLTAPATTVIRVILDFDLSIITSMDEKIHGSDHPLIPSPTRV